MDERGFGTLNDQPLFCKTLLQNPFAKPFCNRTKDAAMLGKGVHSGKCN